jgi:hypothetical protein
LRRSQIKSDLKQAEICRYEFLQLLDFVFQKNGPQVSASIFDGVLPLQTKCKVPAIVGGTGLGFLFREGT